METMTMLSFWWHELPGVFVVVGYRAMFGQVQSQCVIQQLHVVHYDNRWSTHPVAFHSSTVAPWFSAANTLKIHVNKCLELTQRTQQQCISFYDPSSNPRVNICTTPSSSSHVFISVSLNVNTQLINTLMHCKLEELWRGSCWHSPRHCRRC